MCLISQKVLKVYFLRRTILITLAFLKNRNVVGMKKLLQNQCEGSQTFQVFNTLPFIVTSWCDNALFEIQQRCLIKCTVHFGLDEVHWKYLDERRSRRHTVK